MPLIALVLAASLAMAPIAGGADVDGDLRAYGEIVSQYRSGDVAGAVERVETWHTGPLLKTVGTISQLKESERKRLGWDVTQISAAGLLHFEVLVRHPGQPQFEALHLPVMRAHLAGLRRLAALSALTAKLHLALAVHLEGQLKVEDLLLFLDDVGETLASHAPFLLAQGTLHELLASRRLEAARKAVLVPGARTSLDKAERFLRQALAIEPSLTEARLRLAHVVVLQGRPDEGIALLQPVLQASTDSDMRYLAYLFLGEAQADAGRLDLAEKALAAGAAERPCGQAAVMALAHHAFLDRRFAEAREILYLTLRPSIGCSDPWAFYDFGQSRLLPGLITEMRRDLRP